MFIIVFSDSLYFCMVFRFYGAVLVVYNRLRNRRWAAHQPEIKSTFPTKIINSPA